MSFKLETLALVGCAYLLMLFLVARATEKGLVPKKLVHHPATYVLTLGVYVSCWAWFGGSSIAYTDGYAFLAFYFGISGAFMLAPVLLTPILRITSAYQLSSLPDLFAFRFRSPAAGTLSTLLLVATCLPLFALQIKSLNDSINLLSEQPYSDLPAIFFCSVIALFTLSFGSRHLSGRRHHHGLVMAIAVESLLKLVIMLILGGVIIVQVFDGFSGLNLWLEQYPMASRGMNSGLEDGPWRTLLLMFFSSAIVMPHMFHMAFTENRDSTHLYIASWGLPLFLLLLSLSTPLIIWAGIKLGSDLPPTYYTLAIGQILNQPWLSMLAFIGSLTAATGLIIVTTLALASMLMNHIVLPVYQYSLLASSDINIYRWLANAKRALIISIILAAYGFYHFMHSMADMNSLGVVAYAGALQLLPATLSTLYWKKANRQGFLWGLSVGTLTWFTTLMLPLSMGINLLPVIPSAADWHLYATGSLAINVVVFFLVSFFTPMSDGEEGAAKACLVTPINPGKHQIPQAGSAYEFQKLLSKPLGLQIAREEVNKALKDLQMQPDEHRPHALRRLRDRVESNLSGLMGPSVAHEIVENNLPLDPNKGYVPQDIHFIESQLEAYHSRLTGLAAELDGLRRYHRETLTNLPMAVCSVDSSPAGNNEVMLWNQAMVMMTGISAEEALSHPLENIPAPWNSLIVDFLNSNSNHLNKHKIEINNQVCYFNLHKANVSGTRNNQVVLLEDQTDTRLLEEQLFHNERLASIGQLAAGVAHEIGNPITGIDCLAQELPYISAEPEIRSSSQQILEQTKRVNRIVQTLVTYAHSGHPSGNAANENRSIEPVTLHDCVDEAVSLLRFSPKNDNIIFINDCNPEHRVSGNSQKLQQVFINLLNNSSDASNGEGRVIINTEASDMTITVHVEDNGHGIPLPLQEKLFDPFFTTKEAGKGTGLGLALTWNIIKEHFGSIQVTSPADLKKQRGTRFTLSLPRFEPEPKEILQESKPQGETA